MVQHTTITTIKPIKITAQPQPRCANQNQWIRTKKESRKIIFFLLEIEPRQWVTRIISVRRGSEERDNTIFFILIRLAHRSLLLFFWYKKKKSHQNQYHPTIIKTNKDQNPPPSLCLSPSHNPTPYSSFSTTTPFSSSYLASTPQRSHLFSSSISGNNLWLKFWIAEEMERQWGERHREMRMKARKNRK